MRCDECKRQIGTMDFRSFEEASLDPELRSHLESCPECRNWAASTHLISDTLRSTPRLAVSKGFTKRVVDGTAVAQQGFIAGLISKWFGDLRPVGPVLSRRAVLASVLVLVVGVAIFAASVYSPGLAPADNAIVAHNPSPRATTISITAENRSLDELIRCHQDYQMSQPLGPDSGILAAVNLED